MSNALMNFLQAASNTTASNVSAPVDGIAWLLRKAGIPIPENALGGSNWMAEKGLTAPVQQGTSQVLGDTMGLLSPAAVQAAAPRIAAGLLALDDKAMDMARNKLQGYMHGSGLAPNAIVYHGSPHKFDAFDSSKIGTGEGAQAYGHGLYLAESPAVAQSYKDLNPTTLTAPIRAFRGAELTPGTPEYHAATLLDGMGLQQARKTVAGWISSARPEMAREAEGWRKTLETLNAATSKADFKQLKNTGNLYRVDLPDEKIARMLDWDATLSKQPKAVQDHFEPMVAPIRSVMSKPADPGWGDLAAPQNFDPDGWELLGLLRNRDAQLTPQSFLGNGLGPEISQKLRAQGIPGIRYLDGGSRSAGAGTSNFVVFPGEENALRILERNGLPLGR